MPPLAVVHPTKSGYFLIHSTGNCGTLLKYKYNYISVEFFRATFAYNEHLMEPSHAKQDHTYYTLSYELQFDTHPNLMIIRITSKLIFSGTLSP